jgi:hypothetical protein
MFFDMMGWREGRIEGGREIKTERERERERETTVPCSVDFLIHTDSGSGWGKEMCRSPITCLSLESVLCKLTLEGRHYVSCLYPGSHCFFIPPCL